MADIEAFLEAVKQLCIDHDLSIAHEDYHGAFLIEDYCDDNIEWLMAAGDETKQG